MNSFLALLLCSIAPSQAQAYEPELLLSKALTPVSEIEQPSRLQYLNPFAKIGLAVESELGSSKEEDREYSLSLKPKGVVENIEYKRLADALRADVAVSRKITLSQNLQTAYTALVSAALAKEQRASSQELKDLMQKSQKLSALEAHADRADLKNVLKANSELQKSLNEMIESEAQIAGIKDFLARRGLSLDELDVTDLVGPEDIFTRLEEIPVGKTALTSQKLLSELEVVRHDALHGTATRSKWLDGVKLSMRKEKKENVFRLEVGFNLPFLAAQDLDDYKDSLKVAESEVKTQQAILEETQRSAGLAEILRQKISLFRTMGSAPQMKNQALLRQDPALALELQRTSVALRFTKAVLLSEIRNLYVSLLLETENLALQPDLNHLSRSKRKI